MLECLNKSEDEGKNVNWEAVILKLAFLVVYFLI